MVGTIWGLALAGAFLLATHFGLASVRLRPAVVERIGEGPYRGLYSLVAFAAFAWLVLAYEAAPRDVYVWDWSPWQAWVPLMVMPFALLLVVGGLTARNPTSVGQEKALTSAEPAQGLLRITRHPFLWGTGLWALSHMPPNGDARSLLLFGTIAALALVGALLLDAKKRATAGLDWERFEESTSYLPFAAIADGRQSLARAASEFGLWRVAVVVVLYGALLHLHPWLFGVRAIPG